MFSPWPGLCQINNTPLKPLTSWVHCVCFSTFSDVAHAVLERCMTDNVTEKNPNIMSSRNYEVTFDFEFIEDWRTPPHTRLKRRLNRMNPNLMNTNISDFGPRKPTSITSTLEPQDKEKQSNSMGLEREEEEQATEWKPEGLFKQHHPLNLMVGVAILSLSVVCEVYSAGYYYNTIFATNHYCM